MADGRDEQGKNGRPAVHVNLFGWWQFGVYASDAEDAPGTREGNGRVYAASCVCMSLG
ncbi:hypothetical protein [Pontiella sulfatireligans]|uniref:hypothetical protein n=1 Tax=Pontiella sulfatireligans TaxID=2750658 RepID=UPI00144472AA|nr:hypothetical protein [Pontiella sulfatireligans]